MKEGGGYLLFSLLDAATVSELGWSDFTRCLQKMKIRHCRKLLTMATSAEGSSLHLLASSLGFVEESSQT